MWHSCRLIWVVSNVQILKKMRGDTLDAEAHIPWNAVKPYWRSRRNKWRQATKVCVLPLLPALPPKALLIGSCSLVLQKSSIAVRPKLSTVAMLRSWNPTYCLQLHQQTPSVGHLHR